jgi:hypothetical protein
MSEKKKLTPEEIAALQKLPEQAQAKIVFDFLTEHLPQFERLKFPGDAITTALLTAAVNRMVAVDPGQGAAWLRSIADTLEALAKGPKEGHA